MSVVNYAWQETVKHDEIVHIPDLASGVITYTVADLDSPRPVVRIIEPAGFTIENYKERGPGLWSFDIPISTVSGNDTVPSTYGVVVTIGVKDMQNPEIVRRVNVIYGHPIWLEVPQNANATQVHDNNNGKIIVRYSISPRLSEWWALFENVDVVPDVGIESDTKNNVEYQKAFTGSEWWSKYAYDRFIIYIDYVKVGETTIKRLATDDVVSFVGENLFLSYEMVQDKMYNQGNFILTLNPAFPSGVYNVTLRPKLVDVRHHEMIRSFTVTIP